MPRVATFAEIEPEFLAGVARIVWATVTTIDADGRPFSRLLHPRREKARTWKAS